MDLFNTVAVKICRHKHGDLTKHRQKKKKNKVRFSEIQIFLESLASKSFNLSCTVSPSFRLCNGKRERDLSISSKNKTFKPLWLTSSGKMSLSGIKNGLNSNSGFIIRQQESNWSLVSKVGCSAGLAVHSGKQKKAKSCGGRVGGRGACSSLHHAIPTAHGGEWGFGKIPQDWESQLSNETCSVTD